MDFQPRIGDLIRVQNIPFSQKHFNNPELEHWFVPKEGIFQGKVYDQEQFIGYLIENMENGVLEVFFPMPELSGECFLEKIDS